MSIALGVHVVESTHHLVKVGSGDIRREPSAKGNEVKELSSTSVFKNDGETFESRAILFGVITVVSYVDQVHQIFMVQLSHDAQLVLQCRNRGSLVLESLDGHEFMIRSLSQLNLGVIA